MVDEDASDMPQIPLISSLPLQHLLAKMDSRIEEQHLVNVKLSERIDEQHLVNVQLSERMGDSLLAHFDAHAVYALVQAMLQ